MAKINIEGVILTPLKKIRHPKGDIFHGMKKSDEGFSGFGEAYFSTIKSGQVKGWNRHNKMYLNLVVPIGEVTFVIYDDHEEGTFFKVILSPSNYNRLTVPPGLWMGFKGSGRNKNLILNIASIDHDSNEIDRLDLSQIDYDWKSI